ncbi:hypothetical protein DVR12_21015 [Chitinophaga silvatica]|uniref:Uncharacterized protein n=1 Tax=Chitinophaga silvatica TaxID=2282649 RepID=A0A3E1Y634_9BACT|nr:hypothetical protein DVR12_21015 [Chitinophaga silvatica]
MTCKRQTCFVSGGWNSMQKVCLNYPGLIESCKKINKRKTYKIYLETNGKNKFCEEKSDQLNFME